MTSSPKAKPVPLSQKIIRSYDRLSPKEKRIADYIVQNIWTVFALPADRLASRAGTSPATIVRFARRLGFSGFPGLRSAMVNELQEEMKPEDRFRFLSPAKNHLTTVLTIAEQEVSNINETLRGLEDKTFDRFIAVIKKSRCLFTVGIGISSLLARLAAYLLNQAGLRTQFCLKDEHSFLEKLIHATPEDALLGFSFPPYSKETVDAIKFCHERGVPCLAITDRSTAPIVRWTQAALLVRTTNLMFTNSLAAVTMVINAVATEIALSNKSRVVANLDLINAFLAGDFLSDVQRRA